MLFIVSISCWLKIEEINCRVIVFNFLLLYIQSYMTDYIKSRNNVAVQYFQAQESFQRYN